MTTQTYTLADADTLMSRMQAHGVMPEPVNGLCAEVAGRLAGRTLTGAGVTTTVVLALAEMIAAGRAHDTDEAWGQMLRAVEACICDAPEPVRHEAFTHYICVVLLGPDL